MNNSLIPIDSSHFKDKVILRFNNILEGLDSYINSTIDFSSKISGEDYIITLIEKIFEYNDNECYIDFYLKNLTEDDKKKLISLLSPEDKEIFINILNTINTSTIYYKLISKELIPFFTNLNTKEIFFVTFYFTKRPITIWGNYNKKFPCFFLTEEDKNFYMNLFDNI